MKFNEDSFNKAIEDNKIIRWHKHFKDVVKSYLKHESKGQNLPIQRVSVSLLPDMEMEEAEVLSMQCDYACFAVETDENEINTADASAFFLEGYLEAQRRLKSNER